MEILIAGGSGFIGKALIQYLLECNFSQKTNYNITVLGRNKLLLAKLLEQYTQQNKQYNNYLNYLTWRELEYTPDNIINTVAKFDCVINLCGQNIGQQRWTKDYKQQVLSSRIIPSEILAKACVAASKQYNKKISLYNASAIGVYGLANPEMQYTEDFDIDKNYTDFLSEVGYKWEQAASSIIPNFCQDNVRLVLMRFAVVLDWHGGALAKMALPFKLGLGGKIGSGQQDFSWIALEDLVRIIEKLINDSNITGPVNLVAPKYITQADFAKVLANYLNRPCFMPMPSWLVKLLFGQMGDELLLSGQMVKSVRLNNYYQDWLHPNIGEFFN